nr:MAG TPA: hypothetical protein [Bacteriophage sp.]
MCLYILQNQKLPLLLLILYYDNQYQLSRNYV